MKKVENRFFFVEKRGKFDKLDEDKSYNKTHNSQQLKTTYIAFKVHNSFHKSQRSFSSFREVLVIVSLKDVSVQRKCSGVYGDELCHYPSDTV